MAQVGNRLVRNKAREPYGNVSADVVGVFCGQSHGGVKHSELTPGLRSGIVHGESKVGEVSEAVSWVQFVGLLLDQGRCSIGEGPRDHSPVE
eukprot:gene2684-biopygen11613